jgi:hypothetical protein
MIVFVCGIKPFCCYFTIFFGVDQGHLRAPPPTAGRDGVGSGSGSGGAKGDYPSGKREFIIAYFIRVDFNNWQPPNEKLNSFYAFLI